MSNPLSKCVLRYLSRDAADRLVRYAAATHAATTYDLCFRVVPMPGVCEAEVGKYEIHVEGPTERTMCIAWGLILGIEEAGGTRTPQS